MGSDFLSLWLAFAATGMTVTGASLAVRRLVKRLRRLRKARQRWAYYR